MIKIGCSCRSINNGVQGLYSYLPGFWRLPLLYSTSTKEGNPSLSSTLPTLLVSSLGFSPQQSHSTSAKLAVERQAVGATRVSEFDTVENADSVIQFFKQLGFQQSDIRKIVCRFPRILVARVEKTLNPRIKLLNDFGISGSNLVQTIVINPSILNTQFGPAIHAFRTVLGSDDNLSTILKRCNGIYFGISAKSLIPNIELLQNYCSIPIDKIRKEICRQPKPYLLRTDLFQDNLTRVEKIGISRDSSMFNYGLQLISGLSDKRIEDKCEIFKSFGWTQSDVNKLIRRNPMCLTAAEAKIKARLDFLMNQLGFKPDFMVSNICLFTCSIEKRLLPRHRVLQVLKEKGLIQMNYSLPSAAILNESVFLKRLVLLFEEVNEVYAQLTSSTVGTLNVVTFKSQS
ncbi:uncharacterized protein LOC110731297 [Chenopodium quinoa]|uniref:uncharacterized protein LOC110731297 n=1 Tax=Chenopodium quinoa TaxID=63459 RepID=UPI000B793542|nr:uncharacterized protein LOC110731297 [Chenopodium quinoa]